MNIYIKITLYFLAIIVLLPGCTAPQPPPNVTKPLIFTPSQPYIARCFDKCDEIATAIRLVGGNVLQSYTNIDVISFAISPLVISDISILAQLPIYKDRRVLPPQPIEKTQFPTRKIDPAATIKVAQITDSRLNAYAFNNQLTGAVEAHQKNILGEGVIVAVIDSGTANNSEIVPILSDSVIGGENFVPGDAEPSATSTLNDEHGTWVGSMIAGHGSVIMDKTNDLAQAIMRYAPESVIPLNETEIEVPMIGTAPAAKIYALKTFGFDGDGAPSSRIIAAMDRVLTLKTNFDNGMPSEPIAGDGSEENPFVFDSLNIQVLNMSLGGPALFPGREIEDLLGDALLAAGVVVVASAGNEGFAAITGGSPGSGLGSIAVGAANDATHERILREVQLGPGLGIEFRPTDFQQMASFSSRGPTADGRNGVDLVANGMASFVQGADGHIGLVSGTSFSSPTVAGASALLWNAFPLASAMDIKRAIIEGANSDILPLHTSKFAQGHGYLDLHEAMEKLAEADFNDHPPSPKGAEINSKVAHNLEERGILIITTDQLEYSRKLNLSPGQVSQFFIEVDGHTSALEIEIEDILPELPPDQQNIQFGDDLLVTAIDAPLSFDHTSFREFIAIDQTFLIENPQHGLVRFAVMGDWTNVGNISAEISIEREVTLPSTLLPLQATIGDGESHQYTIEIDPSITSINLALQWNKNWAYYPSHDLDLIVVDPDGNLIFDAATLHSPELLTIDLPSVGTWTIIVEGFLLHEMQDDYRLFVSDQNNMSLLSIQ